MQAALAELMIKVNEQNKPIGMTDHGTLLSGSDYDKKYNPEPFKQENDVDKPNIDKPNIDKPNIDKPDGDKPNNKPNIDEPDNKDSMPLYSLNWSIEWLYKKYNKQIARFIQLHLDAGIKLDDLWSYYNDVTYNRCLNGTWELKVNVISRDNYNKILSPLLKYFNITEMNSGNELGCSGYFNYHFYYHVNEQTLNELGLPICYLFDLYEYKEKQVKSFIQSNHTVQTSSLLATYFQINITLGDLYDDVARIYLYHIFDEEQVSISKLNDKSCIVIYILNNSLNWNRYENVFGDQLYKVEKILREEFHVRNKNSNLVV